MPLLKGSLTYSRLFVDGEVPAGFRDTFMKAIRLHAMKPLVADEDVVERSGWCAPSEPFDVEPRHVDVFCGDYVNLGYRVDKWAIPGALLRARVREAEGAALSRRGRDRLSRKEKGELRELVMKKLKKQIPPVTRAVDLSWSLDEGLVRFFSRSERTLVAMSDLFHRTFALKLVPEAPYTLAVRLGLTKAEDERWVTLEATPLTRGE